MDAIYRLQAEMCRVLGHPRRLQILDLLAGGEKSSSELREDLGCSEVNLSQHLALMKRAGLVESRNQGREALHRLTFAEIKDACGIIRNVLALRLRQGMALARALR